MPIKIMLNKNLRLFIGYDILHSTLGHNPASLKTTQIFQSNQQAVNKQHFRSSSA